MHYELWALNTGNLMADYDSETQVRATVRDLIANGWSPDDLGVRLEWDDGEEGDDSELPPAVYGSTLTAWIAESQSKTTSAHPVRTDHESQSRHPSHSIGSGIERRAGVMGGSACIGRTRIAVWLLEEARRLGANEQDLLIAYPFLRAEDIVAAWDYARNHPDEIERDIRENEAA